MCIHIDMCHADSYVMLMLILKMFILMIMILMIFILSILSILLIFKELSARPGRK